MTRADFLLLTASIIALPFVYLHYWQPAAAAVSARILRGEQLVREIPLNRDQEIRVEGRLGTSRLQIKAGKIRFIDSPCSAKTCIHRGWLHHAGDFNACLPNGISLEVLGEGSYDSMNF